MNDDDNQVPDGESKRSPRVDFTETPQSQAGILGPALADIRNAVERVPLSDNHNSSPRFLVGALIRDAESVLEGMELGTVNKGTSRLVTGLIRCVELLESAGLQFEKPILDLQSIILRLSQHGLAIDGHPLTESRHSDRVKS